MLPPPKIVGIEYIGLAWEAEENLATLLVHRPPNALINALPDLLETVSGWVLEHLRLLVLSDFNVCADDAASSQAMELVSSMEMLFQLPMHQAGHMLDLIFGLEITGSCNC